MQPVGRNRFIAPLEGPQGMKSMLHKRIERKAGEHDKDHKQYQAEFELEAAHSFTSGSFS